MAVGCDGKKKTIPFICNQKNTIEKFHNTSAGWFSIFFHDKLSPIVKKWVDFEKSTQIRRSIFAIMITLVNIVIWMTNTEVHTSKILNKTKIETPHDISGRRASTVKCHRFTRHFYERVTCASDVGRRPSHRRFIRFFTLRTKVWIKKRAKCGDRWFSRSERRRAWMCNALRSREPRLHSDDTTRTHYFVTSTAIWRRGECRSGLRRGPRLTVGVKIRRWRTHGKRGRGTRPATRSRRNGRRSRVSRTRKRRAGIKMWQFKVPEWRPLRPVLLLAPRPHRTQHGGRRRHRSSWSRTFDTDRSATCERPIRGRQRTVHGSGLTRNMGLESFNRSESISKIRYRRICLVILCFAKFYLWLV